MLIQIHGGTHQEGQIIFHFQINDIFQGVNLQVIRILVIRAVDGVLKRQRIPLIMESQIPRSKLRDT